LSAGRHLGTIVRRRVIFGTIGRDRTRPPTSGRIRRMVSAQHVPADTRYRVFCTRSQYVDRATILPDVCPVYVYGRFLSNSLPTVGSCPPVCRVTTPNRSASSFCVPNSQRVPPSLSRYRGPPTRAPSVDYYRNYRLNCARRTMDILHLRKGQIDSRHFRHVGIRKERRVGYARALFATIFDSTELNASDGYVGPLARLYVTFNGSVRRPRVITKDRENPFNLKTDFVSAQTNLDYSFVRLI